MLQAVMLYRQIAPPRDLQPWVECVWTLEGALAAAGQTILPDGRRELIFHFGARPVSALGVQPASLITAASAEAVSLSASGRVSVMGIRLRPEAAGCLESGAGPYLDLRDLEMPDGWARRVWERAGNAGGVARVEVVWDALRELVRGWEEPDGAVVRTVQMIAGLRGRGSVAAFVPEGVAERQWQRRFMRACGFSPKVFARITRFQYLVGMYESGGDRTWSEMALEAGFYDQAHLVNEFRAFCGESPAGYFRAGRGMTEFYSIR